MIYDTKTIIYRLLQIFSSRQKINLYWKCPPDTKMADFVNSIDE